MSQILTPTLGPAPGATGAYDNTGRVNGCRYELRDGGPLAEPTPNCDDAIDQSRLYATLWSRFHPTTAWQSPREVDPADLEQTACGTEKFLGRDTRVSQSDSPRQSQK